MMTHSSEEIHTAMRDALAFVAGEPVAPGREDSLLRMFAEEVIRLGEQIHDLHNQLGGESMRCEKAEGDLKRTQEQNEVGTAQIDALHLAIENLQREGDGLREQNGKLMENLEFHRSKGVKLYEQLEAARRVVEAARMVPDQDGEHDQGLNEALAAYDASYPASKPLFDRDPPLPVGLHEGDDFTEVTDPAKERS